MAVFSNVQHDLSLCLQISLTNTMDQLPEKVPDLLVRQGKPDQLYEIIFEE